MSGGVFESFFHRIDTDILLHFINAAPGDRLSFDSTPPPSLNARKSVFYFVSVNETHYMTALKGILRVGRDVLIIVLITVALGEVSLRIYNSIDPLPIFYSDSYNRFRGKPFAPDYNTFHLNSRGFKDLEFSTRKATGTIRILGIGDSFAFGVVPYEYNYLTLVEQNLKKSGHNVELINMGIPSIGPREYLSLLVHEGFALEPDRVLLSFFIGNDFEESRRRKLISYSYVASLITYVLDRWSKFKDKSSTEVRHMTIMRLHSPTISIWGSRSRGAPFFGATIGHLKATSRRL